MRPSPPHLAARMEGVSVPVEEIVRAVTLLRREVSVVLELPGGLFTPLSDMATNADLAAALTPEALLLVAPNRLGVLHDVRAAHEACLARRLALAGVVLSATPSDDSSAATNPIELPKLLGLPLLASLPRASVEDLVTSGALDSLVAYCRACPHQLPALEKPGRAT